MNRYPHMRDPAGNADLYDEYFRMAAYQEADFEQNYADLAPKGKLKRRGVRYRDAQEYLRYQYCSGTSLETLGAALRQRTAHMLEDDAYVRANGQSDARPLSGRDRRSMAYLSLALMLLPEPQILQQISTMYAVANQERSYLVDLLLRAFKPDHPLASDYLAEDAHQAWLDPVVRVLALPPQQRAAAMAGHLQSWPHLMRPWGWRPDLAAATINDSLFAHFAFEVALAVAAYDIDDSSFRDHPYYPRDLVDYYRAHIRATRDGWRGESIGAGVAAIAATPTPRVDLANSARKGLARWIELATDGDEEATDAVLQLTGNPKTVGDLDALLAALAEQRIAVHADIKDDATLEAQITRLGEARGLGPFDGPAQPSQGPARCSALLDAWKPWAAARGYTVYGIDLQDDAWHAILVRHDYQQELQQLSTELAIPLLP